MMTSAPALAVPIPMTPMTAMSHTPNPTAGDDGPITVREPPAGQPKPTSTGPGTVVTVDPNYMDAKSLMKILKYTKGNVHIEWGTPPGNGQPGTARIVYPNGTVQDVTYDYGAHDWCIHL